MECVLEWGLDAYLKTCIYMKRVIAILFCVLLYCYQSQGWSQVKVGDIMQKSQSANVKLIKNRELSEQLTQTNTVYEVESDFDLKGKRISIPEGSSLRFIGGSIKNGALVGNNSIINAGNEQVFDSDVELTGYWASNQINVCWFGAKNDIDYNSTDAFKAANRCAWAIAQKRKEHELYGETNTIKLYIPTGVYYVEGSGLMGSIRDENKYPERNVNTLYQVEGNNSIVYWEVKDKNNVFAIFDYTIGHQSVKDLKIFVVNKSQEKNAGIVFKIGNTTPANKSAGRVYSDAGLSFYSNVHVTNSRKGTGGIYKVFDVVGNGQCDQALVQRCTFESFLYGFHCTNSEAVSWNFETCSFYTSVDGAKYFYITQLSQYLMVNNSTFSYCDGQTLCEYNCDLSSNKKLLGTDRDNIIFNNTRFEGYVQNGKDWFTVFKATAGKLILENTNFDASSSSMLTHQFLLSDLGSVHIDNCAMAKALFTIPKYTKRSLGLGNQNDWAITSLDFRCDNLIFKGYDWDKGVFTDLTDAYLTKGNYFRYADFRDFRGKSSNGSKLQSFYITPCIGGEVQFEEKKMALTTGEGSLRKDILLPPYCVVRKIEMYDKGLLPTNVDAVRIYAGDKNRRVYRDIQLGLNGKEKAHVDLFEGRIIVFDDDIKKQSIYVAFIDDKGKEMEVGRGLLVISYTPLTNPHHYSLKKNSAIIELD